MPTVWEIRMKSHIIPAGIGKQLLQETRLNNIIAVGRFCSYYVILCTYSCAQYRRYCSIVQKPKYDTRGRLGISLPYVCRYLRCIMRVMSHTLLWSLCYYIRICIRIYFELAQGQIVRSAYKTRSALAGLCARARVYRIRKKKCQREYCEGLWILFGGSNTRMYYILKPTSFYSYRVMDVSVFTIHIFCFILFFIFT